jgi:hypothetical protein
MGENKMITLQIKLDNLTLNWFSVDAPIKYKEEILEAFNGERWYNKTDFYMDKIVYKKRCKTPNIVKCEFCDGDGYTYGISGAFSHSCIWCRGEGYKKEIK